MGYTRLLQRVNAHTVMSFCVPDRRDFLFLLNANSNQLTGCFRETSQPCYIYKGKAKTSPFFMFKSFLGHNGALAKKKMESIEQSDNIMTIIS